VSKLFILEVIQLVKNEHHLGRTPLDKNWQTIVHESDLNLSGIDSDDGQRQISVEINTAKAMNRLDWSGLDWTGLDWTGLD